MESAIKRVVRRRAGRGSDEDRGVPRLGRHEAEKDAAYLRRKNAPRGLSVGVHSVIGRFLGDDNVIHMTFTQKFDIYIYCSYASIIMLPISVRGYSSK